MLRIDRVTTKIGDFGETRLADGSRVGKEDLRVEVLGALDEANAVLGLAQLYCDPANSSTLPGIQHALFDIGAVISAPGPARELPSLGPKIAHLTAEVEAGARALPPLTSFVLPGGSPAGAYLHLARTVVRRAERRVVTLHRKSPVDPEILRYLNRLSDYLFVLARVMNDHGATDVLWKPDLGTKSTA
jgi:cob(I)alamin adenosyltransferase